MKGTSKNHSPKTVKCANTNAKVITSSASLAEESYCLNLCGQKICFACTSCKEEENVVQCFSCESRCCQSCKSPSTGNKIEVRNFFRCDFCEKYLCQSCVDVSKVSECYGCERTFCAYYGACDENSPGIMANTCDLCSVFVCGDEKTGCDQIAFEGGKCVVCSENLCFMCVESSSSKCGDCNKVICDVHSDQVAMCDHCGVIYCEDCSSQLNDTMLMTLACLDCS